ncbi:antibiotic biosynthesis monooxygenase [Phytohabitans flavus]|uniref:ABM domain-containing protein n=1 Tax=Phytohabitans flavus TaxID=1076124 RepID=A0A6F8XWD2_9ACTN|nr:hypothetical protein Pflav_045640 [Phytohabitans flavus]
MLHVELDVTEGHDAELRGVYAAEFYPAVSAQPGFVASELLAPVGAGRWRLVIRFATEEQRLAWVDTDLHQKVWPAIAAHLDGFEPVLFVPSGGSDER